MSLITPDFGLIVWMTLIFGIVLFVLAKWGFPMITDSVAKRADRINDSIRQAKEAEEKLKHLAEEQDKLIEQAKVEQHRILQQASESKNAIIEEAKTKASDEAAKIIAQARTEIAAEKESAMRDIRRQVADLSVSVAERVLRKDLKEEKAQDEYVNKLVDELTSSHVDEQLRN